MHGHAPQTSWRPRFYPTQQSASAVPLSQFVNGSAAEPNERTQIPKVLQAVRDRDVPTTRTLVICLDGTGDKFDQDNSNVVNFVACLKKDDPEQLTYYQTGIGTYDGSGMKSGVSAAVDMAVGSGLGIHVRDAYRFLMQNYREGDKICLLGFSRGAYTVRCLAGMLHKVGLLPKHNPAQIPFAYKFYKDDTENGFAMSAEFKRTFCTNVEVYFIGVWDCVASVGFVPRKLPFSNSPSNTIGYFRHAMALDEHRAKFKLCHWQQQNPAGVNPAGVSPFVDTTPKAERKATKSQLRGLLESCFARETIPDDDSIKKEILRKDSLLSKLDGQRSKNGKILEAQFEARHRSLKERPKTDALEVWFTGCHADVGGGAVLNEERHMLSRIPLRWMIRQCFECNTGILFNSAQLAETGLDVTTLWPSYKKLKKPVVGPSPSEVEGYEAKRLPPLRRRATALGMDEDIDEKATLVDLRNGSASHQGAYPTGSISALDLLPEQVEDHFDAMAPVNDQLVQAKGWWILELWPIKVRVQKDDSEMWEKVVRPNLGRFRPVRETEPQMHWSVQMRMSEKAYRVRNRVDRNAFWQIAA